MDLNSLLKKYGSKNLSKSKCNERISNNMLNYNLCSGLNPNNINKTLVGNETLNFYNLETNKKANKVGDVYLNKSLYECQELCDNDKDCQMYSVKNHYNCQLFDNQDINNNKSSNNTNLYKRITDSNNVKCPNNKSFEKPCGGKPKSKSYSQYQTDDINTCFNICKSDPKCKMISYDLKNLNAKKGYCEIIKSSPNSNNLSLNRNFNTYVKDIKQKMEVEEELRKKYNEIKDNKKGNYCYLDEFKKCKEMKQTHINNIKNINNNIIPEKKPVQIINDTKIYICNRKDGHCNNGFLYADELGNPTYNSLTSLVDNSHYNQKYSSKNQKNNDYNKFTPFYNDYNEPVRYCPDGTEITENIECNPKVGNLAGSPYIPYEEHLLNGSETSNILNNSGTSYSNLLPK